MPSLSVVTITKNEEAHLPRALRSVRDWADEIIVVDSESTDRTVEIAREFTDKVFIRPWPGYGPQKNFARDRASGEWIFQLDADEDVSPELAEEIQRLLRNPPHEYSWLPIVTEFLGKPLPHLRGMNLRLFRKAAGRWDDKAVHEQVERISRGIEDAGRERRTVRLGDPDTGVLTTPILHHSHYQTLAAYRERQERYATADAREMRRTGADRVGHPVRVRPRHPLSVGRFLLERPLKQFVRKFFRQKGILDGWRGWLWCAVSAEYEFTMCRKYLALARETEKEGRMEKRGTE